MILQNHMNTGTIKQVIGPVVDVYFEGDIPALRNALKTHVGDREITLEVAQHVGLGRVRCIALQDTSGLAREGKVEDTGSAVSVPVGEKVLGRLFNVVGNTLDGKGDIKDAPLSSIHREAPAFHEQRTKAEVFETGIKSIDLLGPLRRRRRGQNCAHAGIDPQHRIRARRLLSVCRRRRARPRR
jgi:F-type H+-transporting ATPase subunit beta